MTSLQSRKNVGALQYFKFLGRNKILQAITVEA
jgi:hypothetical protein